jgi:hypothetical protein
MPGKTVNSLETRKRLLIAESEVNRVLLTRDYQALTGNIHEIGQPLRNIGLLASSATALLSVLKVFRDRPSEPAERKKFWSFTNLLRLGIAFWFSLRRKSHE